MIEASYQTIASELNAACPPGYDVAWIEATVADSSSSKEYWCEVNGRRAQPETDGLADVKITRALIDIRRTMSGEDAPSWSSCKFTLFPDGNFKFDVAHDD